MTPGSLEYYAFVAVFYSLVIYLVYLNRNKLEKQASFIYLYKTRLGLKWMDTIGKKYKKLIKVIGFLGIIVAYIGFVFITVLLFKGAFDLIVGKPDAVGGSPVVPGLPIAGTGIIFPLIIGWISLFLVIVVHEFSHGIMAKAYNLPIKSSGIAFFGPLLGAFVEIDEKALSKQKHRVQHSVFAAGPVSNIIQLGVAAIIFSLLFPSAGISVMVMQNETYGAYQSDLPQNATITAINGEKITSLGGLSRELEKYGAGETIMVKTHTDTYEVTLSENPDDPDSGYMGIWYLGEVRPFFLDLSGVPFADLIIGWIEEILIWTGFLALNLGLINLFPFFISDGARMLKLNFEMVFKKKRALQLWTNFNAIATVVLLILVVMPLSRDILFPYMKKLFEIIIALL